MKVHPPVPHRMFSAVAPSAGSTVWSSVCCVLCRDPDCLHSVLALGGTEAAGSAAIWHDDGMHCKHSLNVIYFNTIGLQE